MLQSDIVKRTVTIEGEKAILKMELDELLFVLRKEKFLTQGEILEVVNNSLKSEHQLEKQLNEIPERTKQEARKRFEKMIKRAKRRKIFQKNDQVVDVKVHEINVKDLDEEGQELMRRLIDKFTEM